MSPLGQMYCPTWVWSVVDNILGPACPSAWQSELSTPRPVHSARSQVPGLRPAELHRCPTDKLTTAASELLQTTDSNGSESSSSGVELGAARDRAADGVHLV